MRMCVCGHVNSTNQLRIYSSACCATLFHLTTNRVTSKKAADADADARAAAAEEY